MGQTPSQLLLGRGHEKRLPKLNKLGELSTQTQPFPDVNPFPYVGPP